MGIYSLTLEFQHTRVKEGRLGLAKYQEWQKVEYSKIYGLETRKKVVIC
jgi:hypothetical protein